MGFSLFGERFGSPTAAGDGRWLRIHRPKNPGASTLNRRAAVRVHPFVRSLSIRLPAMTHSIDRNQLRLIIDCINHPVVSNAYAVSLL
jgi:hypothetical protein